MEQCAGGAAPVPYFSMKYLSVFLLAVVLGGAAVAQLRTPQQPIDSPQARLVIAWNKWVRVSNEQTVVLQELEDEYKRNNPMDSLVIGQVRDSQRARRLKAWDVAISCQERALKFMKEARQAENSY